MSSRFTAAFVATGIALAANAAYLAAFDTPSLFYVANVLFHVGGGIAWAALLAVALSAWRPRSGRVLWGATAALWTVAIGTAALLAVRGTTRGLKPVLTAHIVASVLGILALLLLARPRGPIASARRVWLVAAAVTAAAIVAPPAWRAHARRYPAEVDVVRNPALPPLAMEGEGEGPVSPTFPSSSRIDAEGKRIDSSFFMGSEACARCHPDIHAQWTESAHRFSSFNNQWYRASIEYMQSVAGTKPARWCAGCHDPAPLFSGMMDKPVKEILHTPEAQVGLSCTACHAITRVHITMGQGDYTIRYPPLHSLLTSGNRAVQVVHDYVTNLDPGPHRETFLRPFMREESDKFCVGCHKVHLDVPVNDYRWFRGFNEYDAWQNSGISMNNARAFYHPDKARTCADCHMPRVKGDDPAAKDGMIRSHRFIAANTALPTANGHATQLRLTQEFLQAGKVSVDVFAVSAVPRRAVATSATAAHEQSSLAASDDVAPAAVGTADVAPLRGPFDRAPVRARRGESVRVEVVVRTRDVGHLFPGGTMDAFDVWLELKATDERGKVVLWSGEAADGGKGPVDPAAHRWHVALIDARGNPINKRNAWAARALVYARAIPPGAADTVHFRLDVPRDAGDRITLEAKVNYRKFSWWNTHFSYAGRPDPAQGPASVAKDHDDRRFVFDADTSGVSGALKEVPDLPITVMARDVATLEVVDAAAEPAPAAEHADDRGRWNDYGIGLLLQGHLKAAEAAFLTVTRIDPKYADGWVNVARCRLETGDTTGAREALGRALELAPELAKAHYFMGSAMRRDGEYEPALEQLRRASAKFPGDRVIHNEIGRVLFLMRRYDEAEQSLRRTLEIDPEDLMAHYTMMLTARGRGDDAAAARHEALYRRFKADERSQHLLGPYLRDHPHDNNERQPIHEHGAAS
jgi:Tfp pilus assembly protein PilF